jgi:hypothetical protein
MALSFLQLASGGWLLNTGIRLARYGLRVRGTYIQLFPPFDLKISNIEQRISNRRSILTKLAKCSTSIFCGSLFSDF